MSFLACVPSLGFSRVSVACSGRGRVLAAAGERGASGDITHTSPSTSPAAQGGVTARNKEIIIGVRRLISALYYL